VIVGLEPQSSIAATSSLSTLPLLYANDPGAQWATQGDLSVGYSGRRLPGLLNQPRQFVFCILTLMIYLQFSEYKNSKKNNTQTDFKVRSVSKFIISWTIDYIL